MTDTTLDAVVSENDLMAQRRAKLETLRSDGNAFPNDFRRNAVAKELHAMYGDEDNETLQEKRARVSVAGRMMLCRVMGKASFIQLQDMSGRIQCYLRKNDLPEGVYETFQTWDLGDIVGVEGFVFKTKTGELSIHAETVQLITKSLRPLPDKFHGLQNVETRYRQRYLDLIMNEESRRVFLIKTQIIDGIRDFLKARHFIEVETPIMQVIPGGASARPFVTHHNALDMPLYLRIAPELYLKRLVVGGFERVFELNRNFRNEGISTRHNPEFTMLEFYQAYADYTELMNLTEELLRTLAESILGTTVITYQEYTFDWSKPFARMSMRDSILHFNPEITAQDIDHLDSARQVAERLHIQFQKHDGLGKLQSLIFEETVEHHLIQPTFITEYPYEISPLARRNDQNPFITDRFEFFMASKEIANGFSELNDPEDQADRFREQVKQKEAGDEEAMYYDADYVTALEYGMPPAAGEGIGIDRLVMLMTNSASIRDVILFPHMRL
ncbi:MAG: lysine--tRNA ligase [Gammaproteobacteria bacterium]|nr:lysine--tRNA ligase [Gammaproteobacteria bacterium]MBU1559022.1 lysine--tRNA ligase [Gammaproteobacteria bacterium]MBU1926354.1 lysine--tRNA ligase [Gammaproteobacteria bacterium]MBU2546052.1 lysine--tRNA ligase [Gammaproteobacteria bacterium]